LTETPIAGSRGRQHWVAQSAADGHQKYSTWSSENPAVVRAAILHLVTWNPAFIRGEGCAQRRARHG